MPRRMRDADFHVKPVLRACCSIVILLFLSILGAQQIEKSTIYRQSAFVSSIVAQDTFDVSGFLGTRRNLSLLQKFLTAVTDAYINFELIPVNEANTFAAVYESLNDDIQVERFAYQRKNLIIYGSASSQARYQEFALALRESGHFEGVSGHFYFSTDGLVRFELECASTATATYLDFTQFPGGG